MHTQNGRLTMSTVVNILLVAVGGGAGAVVRYSMALALSRVSLTMPWGTLMANWAGCFLMGLVAAVTGRGLPLSPAARLLLTTGFCGGLTTFSTFMFELHTLASAREVFYGTIYFVASVGGSAMAFVMGLVVVHICIRQ